MVQKKIDYNIINTIDYFIDSTLSHIPTNHNKPQPNEPCPLTIPTRSANANAKLTAKDDGLECSTSAWRNYSRRMMST